MASRGPPTKVRRAGSPACPPKRLARRSRREGVVARCRVVSVNGGEPRRHIGRLGPLELFLNTPSHHRVHHGINPKYIDKNYGGILIVWDRLFGTFAPEEEEPVYGLNKSS